jgi:hypothetical protein
LRFVLCTETTAEEEEYDQLPFVEAVSKDLGPGEEEGKSGLGYGKEEEGINMHVIPQSSHLRRRIAELHIKPESNASRQGLFDYYVHHTIHINTWLMSRQYQRFVSDANNAYYPTIPLKNARTPR